MKWIFCMHESFIQINAMVLIGMVRLSQSLWNSKFPMSLQHLKKDVRDEVDFFYIQTSTFLQAEIIIFDGSGQTYPKFTECFLLWCKIFSCFIGLQSCLLILVLYYSWLGFWCKCFSRIMLVFELWIKKVLKNNIASFCKFNMMALFSDFFFFVIDDLILWC